MRTWLFAAILAWTAGPAAADVKFPPVTDEATKKECGACHMAFLPQLLPQRSWLKIMDTLPDHFGENASLPEPTRTQVADYLVAHAGDVSGSRAVRRFVGSIENGQTPMRITEVPRWTREHGEVRPNAWSDPRVRSKANCIACHRGADAGWYDDD